MSHGTSDLPPSTDPNPSSNPIPATKPISQPTSRRAHPTFHFLAGLGSGITSAVLLQPVDLLKTRVQQSRNSSLVPVFRSILAGPNPVSELWRGTVPSALRTGFGSALYFTLLSSLRQVFANNSASNLYGGSANNRDAVLRSSSSSVLPKLSPTGNLITGATARVMAGLVLMPMTVIKVRYESDFYAYKSLATAVTSIYKTEGLRGFFAGFGATAVRDAPYAGLYVVFYESSKTRLSRFLNSEGRSSTTTSAATVNATSGVIAAVSATAITNPVDAVKTRLQLMPLKYQNTLKAARTMFREDGARAFFDGLALRMARKAASSALVWAVYEELIGRAERQLFQDDAKSAAAL